MLNPYLFFSLKSIFLLFLNEFILFESSSKTHVDDFEANWQWHFPFIIWKHSIRSDVLHD